MHGFIYFLQSNFVTIEINGPDSISDQGFNEALIEDTQSKGAGTPLRPNYITSTILQRSSRPFGIRKKKKEDNFDHR